MGASAYNSYPLVAGDVMTRVLEAAPESGSAAATVVFVHGVASRADRFRPNLGPLAEAGLHAVALDLPGHGFAEKGKREYGVAPYAEFVRAALAAMELEDVVLVGSSLGGNVAARVALDDPGAVRALVLVGSVGIVPLGPELRAAVAKSVAAAQTREGVEAKLRRLFFDQGLVTEGLVHEELAFATAPGADVAIAELAAYFEDRIDDDVVGPALAELAEPPPILLVWGAEDRSVPLAVGRQAAALLGTGEPAVIDAAGHAPYYEQAAQFNTLLTRFIATIGKSN